MAFAPCQFTVLDQQGNVQSGASITVREHGEVLPFPLANIYEDEDGTTPLSNPFTADENGFVRFYATGGFYQVTATLGAFSQTLEKVPVGTAQGLDIGQLLALVGTGALTPRGAYDGGTTYSLYNIVLDQGSSWIYIHADPSAGNAPPTLPDTANEHWMLIAIQGEDGAGLHYDVATYYAYRDGYTDEEQFYAVLCLDGDPTASPPIEEPCIFILLQPGSPFEWSDPIIVRGQQGLQGTTPTFVLRFSTTTADGDPGSGTFRLNHGTKSSVTFIYADDLAQSGANIESWLNEVKAGDQIHIRHLTNPAIEARYKATGARTNASGYSKVPVTHISSIGTFASGDDFAIAIYPVGPAGDVDAAGVVKTGVTTNMTVGVTHTPSDHGTKGSGEQSVQPQPSLGLLQKVTLSSGTKLTITPPSENGNVILDIINPASGATDGLVTSGFTKAFPGDAYVTTANKIFRAYITRMDTRTTILLRAVV